MEWVDNILPIVMTRLKAEGNKALKSTYPNLNFTDDNATPSEAKFPTVYVLGLSSPETGQDLQGITINALNYGVQIEVTDNQSKTNAREVMSIVRNIMKTMRFTGEILSEPVKENGVYRSVARFRRMIASGDNL